MHSQTGKAITIRFALPSAELSPFITTYYFTEVSHDPDDPWVEDYLHPEWPNLRVLCGSQSQSAIGDAPLVDVPGFSVSGPTSKATRFRLSGGRNWGIGLLPLGWAKFCSVPADDYADRFVDGASDPAFADLAPLAHKLQSSASDFASDVATINAHMRRLLDRPLRGEAKILAVNEALIDPAIVSVTDLAERTHMNVRSLERLCKRAFGFPPKLLLRRQRFLRSLAKFMLDPTMKWLSTMDENYHDQAHFARDFSRFMGMMPSEYGKLDHPFLRAAAQARNAIAGEAVQALHDPNQRTG